MLLACSIDAPSLWSFLDVRRIGVSFPWAAASHVVSAFNAQLWHWPPLSIYRGKFMLVLNGNVASHVALYVTAPQPPLETSAGIVGFTVEPPGDPNRRLEMRVLAAVASPDLRQPDVDPTALRLIGFEARQSNQLSMALAHNHPEVNGKT